MLLLSEFLQKPLNTRQDPIINFFASFLSAFIVNCHLVNCKKNCDLVVTYLLSTIYIFIYPSFLALHWCGRGESAIHESSMHVNGQWLCGVMVVCVV
jgi:hypothetical protein